jgi:hypothetical protein
MTRTLTFALLCLVAATLPAAEPSGPVITTGTMLEQMTDLAQLARWPQPAYRTVQFSSFDRRSTTSESPGWFSNADGFGREPIPGFQKVLREPRDGQPGLFLLAEVNGPGAIVRGWTAGMAGVLRVYLDPGANGDGTLIWEGPAADFLARRTAHYVGKAGCDLDTKNAISQEDADYLPIPFARGLRVTWEGKLDELHFYHLQVRLYPAGTEVRTFDSQKDLKDFEQQLRAAAAGLLAASSGCDVPRVELQGAIEPGRSWTWSPNEKGSGAVRELKLRLQADALDAALRGCLLRISCDGSQRPQVEAPVGDFFASGPGVNPYSSLPFSVDPDGTMTCRWVMPFEKSLRLEIVNYTSAAVRLAGSIQVSPWQWDERSLYFRAKWRADHDLLADSRAIDLPYTVTIGKGVFVGCAAMIMNPSGVPTAGGNWWGEGDEKFVVDGETVPSTFGTGSEDYFNYSWSRSNLFSHPYCGQPLDSGPDTSGYVSNHRFQIPDSIPFEKSWAAILELWSHNRTPGLSYARIAYLYARPGAIDDHRALMPSDLKIPQLPKREPKAAGGATGARFLFPEQLQPVVTAGRIEPAACPLATQLKVTQWQAEKGAQLKFTLPVEEGGNNAIHLVALHRPDGAVVRVLVDGKPLPGGEGGQFSLRSAFAPRILNVNLPAIELTAGPHEVALECVEAGVVGLDYLWVKRE